jgi:hypothetical protein
LIQPCGQDGAGVVVDQPAADEGSNELPVFGGQPQGGVDEAGQQGDAVGVGHIRDSCRGVAGRGRR